MGYIGGVFHVFLGEFVYVDFFSYFCRRIVTIYGRIIMKCKVLARIVVLGFVVLVSMLTACSDSDNQEQGGREDPESEATPPTDVSTQTLLEVIEKSEYTPTEFGEAIGSWPMLSYAGEGVANLMKRTLRNVATTRIPLMDARFLRTVGLDANGSRQWIIKRRVFTYQSISNMTGNDTILVGSVIFPTNTVGKPHQVDILTLYHHQAYFEKSWLPSQSVTLMAMHALNNSAVIEPDGLGASDDMNKLTYETIFGDLSCLQMVDCVSAALEVMRQEGVTLADNGYTNNWGTSLGTTSATAFAQYMENDATPELQQLLKLRATYIGEGPTMFSQIKGCKKYEPELPVQKYFYGWNPRLPFYMSSCKDDELIVYDELKSYYTQLRTMPDGSVNTNVKWCDFYMPAIVKSITSSEDLSKMTWGIGNHLLSAVVSLMAASIVKDPDDMERILMSNNIFDEE